MDSKLTLTCKHCKSKDVPGISELMLCHSCYNSSGALAQLDAWKELALREGQQLTVALSELTNLEQKLMMAARHRDLLNKLLYAITNKHPGESRFETALRYLKERNNVQVRSARRQ